MMSRSCDSLSDREINLGIQIYLNQVKSYYPNTTKAYNIQIPMDILQDVLSAKYKCDGLIPEVRLLPLLQAIIKTRNQSTDGPSFILAIPSAQSLRPNIPIIKKSISREQWPLEIFEEVSKEAIEYPSLRPLIDQAREAKDYDSFNEAVIVLEDAIKSLPIEALPLDMKPSTLANVEGSYSGIIQIELTEKNKEGNLIPKKFNLATTGWPPGLIIIPDFFNHTEQNQLFDYISHLSWKQPEVLALTKKLARDTQQYGYVYNYASKGRNHVLSLVNNPPPKIKCIADFLYLHKFIPTEPNQIIINRYLPGEGIAAHADGAIFDGTIISLSLGSTVLMRFNKGSDNIDIPLLPGSLLIMNNDARLNWTHAIEKRKSDSYLIKGYPTQKWQRGERISITFRTVKTAFRGPDLRRVK